MAFIELQRGQTVGRHEARKCGGFIGEQKVRGRVLRGAAQDVGTSV